ncbi:MAG: C10 family peptidase, partial [Candidatus Cloacimonadaceae bacterium]
MKKLFITIIFLLLITLFWAKPVEKQTALSVAEGFANYYSAGRNRVDSIEDFFSSDKTLPDFYIVRLKPVGFILVAGDDRSMPILGYSWESLFLKQELPPHIQWYLEQYSLSMEEIRLHNEWSVDHLWGKIAQGDYSYWEFDRNVWPLLTTTWDQGWPYNSMCPSDTEGSGGHVYAGCVATAMAQVMKKWDYPNTGNGSHSYYAEGYGTQTANFGATTYNWSNMPNSITTVNNSIATLLYHCGVAVDMQYSPYGSGAYSEDARYAMVNYFRYNSSAQLLYASDYSSSTWCSMLRGDLDLGRPIYYAGNNGSSGHAFVLDGYQGTNYFHINWGWSGSYNGYFYLTNLNPGSHSFNQDQEAMLYVYPINTFVNDLATVSLTGNNFPTVGQSYDYIITINNSGTNPQSTYQVKLLLGTQEIGSVNGTAIQPGAILTYTIPWTPTTAGPGVLYGKVVLTGDQNPNNDQTPPLSITVQPQGVQTVTIGAGDQTARVPMDFYWKNSLFETIYLASELNIGGLLTDIQFYNNFSSNLPNKPTNIWVGETTQTDLSAGWIPSTQLTQVFNGNVNYPSGQNNILIHLTTPYAYCGGNLVVMVERPMDTQYYSNNDVFRTQVGTVANRTRNVYDDGIDYDPANPPTATPQSMFPMTTFMFITEGLGAINGTIYTTGNVPLPGATVTVVGTPLSYTTGADGTFMFPYVAEGEHQVTATKYGYNEVTNTVTVVENQTVTTNFILTPLPQVTVSGRIVGSDQPTVGLVNATISLTGYENYEATTNNNGQFTINNVYANHTYNYVASAMGYQSTTGQVVVVSTNVNMGDIVLNECIYPPSGVQTVEINSSLVNLTWNAPSAVENITEGFEGTLFPPESWSQIITDNGPAVGAGILPTWCQAGTIALTTPVPPHSGSYQAAMWWDYVHQDEWLSTPQFVCPADADLVFWSYVYLGSTNGDHYYIKVSTDNGNTWTVLWDASDLTGGWNYYATPIVIDLDYYAGQQIKLAWHADDPPSNDGMWYVWFVDDVTVGNTKETIHFPINTLTRISAKDETHPALRMVTPQLPTSRALASTSIIKSTRQIAQEPIMRNDRVLNGYKVWRLLQGQETNESAWTLLTTDIITATAYQDTGWGSVPDGIYKWAVKAVYTSGALSNPAFSNALPKWTQIGTIAGTVKNQQNAPIAGAAVTCENVTATTNASGAYSMQVPAGTRSVTASAPGYDSVTQNNVIVVTGQTTTVNFILPPSIIVELLNDSFETYENFALTFAPWTCVDVDQSTTYGIEATFPNCYSPMAYIIFVPSATTPPLTATGVTHTGNKIAASFAAATTFPNNDWLITPSLLNPTQIKFWARSYTAQYGLERFKVGVSTTGTNPSDFTIISGPNFVEAPVDWTEYTYPITGYTGNVYIGIQCVSNDAFIFLVDDVLVMGTQGPNQNIPLSSGWNLISLNVSPADHSLNVLLAPIINQVIQVKGLDGVYIPNNPFSTLTTLTDGRAYNILMSSPATWTVSGAPIPVSTP